jgi:hypothetical protein
MRRATTHAPNQTKAALWISFFLGLWVNLWSLDAAALPLYATREGRTCDNCHINPNGWTNPDLSDRKCNLSCSGCHVDPLGGGLRTVSGRFYGESTLPMFLPSHRG